MQLSKSLCRCVEFADVCRRLDKSGMAVAQLTKLSTIAARLGVAYANGGGPAVEIRLQAARRRVDQSAEMMGLKTDWAAHDANAKRAADRLARELCVTRVPRTLTQAERVVEVLNCGVTNGVPRV